MSLTVTPTEELAREWWHENGEEIPDYHDWMSRQDEVKEDARCVRYNADAVASLTALLDRVKEEALSKVVSKWTEVECRSFMLTVDARLDDLGCTVDSTFRHGKDEGRVEERERFVRISQEVLGESFVGLAEIVRRMKEGKP